LFTGHYSVSFAGRAAEKRIPLWLLFIAVQFIDVLWSIFVLLGIEKVRIVPGITASNALDLYYMPYTHSLAAAILWSVAVAVLARLLPGVTTRSAAVWIGIAVFSHWVLDVLVHRPDLPLYDDTMKIGFGLWNYPAVALALEAANRGLAIEKLALYEAPFIVDNSRPPTPEDFVAQLNSLIALERRSDAEPGY